MSTAPSPNLRDVKEMLASLPTAQTTAQSDDNLPSQASQCAVCLEAFEAGETTKTLPCFHFFHQRCIERWFTEATMTVCPICRRNALES